MNRVRTVLGDVLAAQLGATNYHEHLFQVSPLLPGDDLDDEPKSTAEAGLLVAAGTAAMVDATPTGLGRRPAALARISAGTGLHIVATTGAHRDAHYGVGHWLTELSVAELAHRFTADVRDGMLIADSPEPARPANTTVAPRTAGAPDRISAPGSPGTATDPTCAPDRISAPGSPGAATDPASAPERPSSPSAATDPARTPERPSSPSAATDPARTPERPSSPGSATGPASAPERPSSLDFPDIATDSTGTPVRAGLLKAGIDYWSITPFERRVIEAIGLTHAATGAPVMIHLEHGSAAFEVLELLADCGVPADAVALAHIDRNPDPGLHAELAATGAYLGYDGVARTRSWPDSMVLDCLLGAADRGAADRILLGGDVARRSRYVSYGGMPGLAYLSDRFLPRLRAAGSSELVEQVLRRNPQRWLARFGR